MAKTAGMGDQLFVSGYDLSGDIASLERIGGGPNLLVVTAINASGFERVGGVRDGAMDITSWFNPAANASHDRFENLPTGDVLATYCHGTTLGNPAASLIAKQVSYDGTRGADGALSFSVPHVANGYGLEWGDQLTAGKRTDTAATEGTGTSTASATTNFGIQAYLHVFSFSGTDVTVKIQESSDNGADTYADVVGGGFSQILTGGAPTSQRIATATNLAVERFLKVTTVTTGGFSSLVFSVMAVRNWVTPQF